MVRKQEILPAHGCFAFDENDRLVIVEVKIITILNSGSEIEIQYCTEDERVIDCVYRVFDNNALCRIISFCDNSYSADMELRQAIGRVLACGASVDPYILQSYKNRTLITDYIDNLIDK